MKKPRGSNMDRAIVLLGEMGKATRYELELRLGVTKGVASELVRRLCKPMKLGPQAGTRRAHICGWTDYVEGTRFMIRPVYALGNKPDKPYPGPKPVHQINREHWQKRKTRIARMKPGLDLQNAWLGR